MKCFSRLLVIIVLLASTSPVLAASFLITNRRSSACSSLFAIAKSFEVPASAHRDFANELQAITQDLASMFQLPIAQDQKAKALCTHATEDEGTLDNLAVRASEVIRNLRGTSRSMNVIAAARLDEQSLSAFKSLVENELELIQEKQQRRYKEKGGNKEEFKHKIVYRLSPIEVAFIAAIEIYSAVSLLSWTLGAPSDASDIALYAGILFGFTDFPIRVANFSDSSLTSLRREILSFHKSGEPWAYWSKDFQVTEGFVKDLTESKGADWEAIHKLNMYEQTPAFLRIPRYWHDRSNPWYKPATLSVDVLMSRTKAGPEIRFVMRSSHLSPP